MAFSVGTENWGEDAHIRDAFFLSMKDAFYSVHSSVCVQYLQSQTKLDEQIGSLLKANIWNTIKHWASITF